MEDDGCSPSTWEVEIAGSGVQDLPQLYNVVKSKPAVWDPNTKQKQKSKCIVNALKAIYKLFIIFQC